jgi:4-hydroxy-2-oxoheptanedioate aldolase
MIPRVSDAGQVREVVQMMKYPPQGLRGNSLGLGFTNFKSGPVAEALLQANDETMLVVQIENQAAVDHIDEIVAVPGVDVALIGPNDLSISLGLPGQIDAPPVRAAIAKTIAACQRQGVTSGIAMDNRELAVYWAKQGMRLLGSHAETGLIMKAGQEVVQGLRRAFEEDKDK